MHIPHPAFSMDVENLHPGSHACTASSLNCWATSQHWLLSWSDYFLRRQMAFSLRLGLLLSRRGGGQRSLRFYLENVRSLILSFHTHLWCVESSAGFPSLQERVFHVPEDEGEVWGRKSCGRSLGMGRMRNRTKSIRSPWKACWNRGYVAPHPESLLSLVLQA